MITEEQRIARKNGIGSTDVSAILGINPWKTPIDIYLEKTSDYQKEVDLDQQFNLDAGNAMEPVLIEYASKKYGWNILDNLQTAHHPSYPFLFTNIDGVIVGKQQEHIGILEIKTAYEKSDEWGDEGTCEIPNYYIYQLAHSCMTWKSPRAYLLVWFKKENKRYLYVYNHSIEIEEFIIKEMVNFWENNVLKRVIPDPVTNNDRLLTFSNKEIIKTESLDVLNSIQECKNIKKEIKNLSERFDSNKEFILKNIGGYGEVIDLTDTKIASYKQYESSSFDTKKFNLDYPDLYNAYLNKKMTATFKLY